jgi:hypothetical protein
VNDLTGNEAGIVGHKKGERISKVNRLTSALIVCSETTCSISLSACGVRSTILSILTP